MKIVINLRMSEVIRYAYNPENQGGAMQSSQSDGSLYGEMIRFRNISVRTELGQRWISINDEWGIFLLDSNFNIELAGLLRKGDALIGVMGRNKFQNERGVFIPPIGALLFGKDILYKSSGFDLEALDLRSVKINDLRYPRPRRKKRVYKQNRVPREIPEISDE